MLKKIAFIVFILVCFFTFNTNITKGQTELPQASTTKETDFSPSSYELISPIGNLSKIDDQDKNGFSGFINLIIVIAIALAGAIAVITIIVSGIQYMGTDSVWEKGESKMKISTAVGGIVLLLCSYIILNTINPDLVNIKIGGMKRINDAEWEKVEFLQSKITGISAKQYRDTNKYIKEEYIPARDKALPNASKGAKALITAHASMEGFYPGAMSYRTNNPGNIGNDGTPGKAVTYATLEEGIKAQYNYIEKVLTNKKDPYILNKEIIRPTAEDYDPTTKQKRTYPGVRIIYNGTIGHYLQLYSVAARPTLDGVSNPTYKNYENFLIAYFKTEGLTLTPSTTMQQIYDMK